MNRGSPPDGWGIDAGWWDVQGRWHDTAPATRAALRVAMGGSDSLPHPPPGRPVWVVPSGWGEDLLDPCHLVLESGTDVGIVTALPPDLPYGRHRLVPAHGGPETHLIVRPRACHLPHGFRAAALAVQLYAARSRASWGIGDFRDLRSLGAWAAAGGLDLVALNPLHAPDPGDSPQTSPYYPSSRRFLNPLYLAVEEVPGAGLDPVVAELAEQARALSSERLVDRAAAWKAKRTALERLFDARGTAIDVEVEAFRTRRGRDLQRWATYCAIHEVHGGPWTDWPSELRHPSGPGVEAFGRDHSDRLRFHCWLQWLAERQLRDAAASCPFILDLAVGVDPAGADAWSDQDLLALDCRVGAPPDEFNADGQDWGLPPYIPHRIRSTGYEAFASTVRANLRAGGGLRVDHVLGLFRLFWLPPPGTAESGTYVRYAADELLAVLAIESVRADAFVVGEDLGTVEPGMREALEANRVLGTKLVLFEEGPPSSWPVQSLGAVTTHDLPTIAGIWTGADARAREDAGLKRDGTEALRDKFTPFAPADAPVEQVVEAAHAALAESPSAVVYGTLDDVLAVPERPNMPGTVDEWPNWCLSLPVPLDDLLADAPPVALTSLARRR